MPVYRTVSEACYCCAGGECCAFNGGYTFVPSTGFTLESTTPTNPNTDNCVGRARLEVLLSKPASPGVTCDSGTCGAITKCSGVPWQIYEAFWPVLIAMIEGYGWEYTGLFSSVAHFGSSAYHPDLVGCFREGTRYGFDNSQVYCPEKLVNIPAGLFKKTFPGGYDIAPAICGLNGDAVWFNNNHRNPMLDTLNAELQANPWKKVITRNGYQCEYWAFGCTDRTMVSTACTKCTPAPVMIQWGSFPYIIINFGIKCSLNPCTMGDYSWPLSLDCACESKYTPPTPSGDPDCKLYFTSSSRYYEGDKCFFKGIYEGAIAANEIDCSSTPDAPDCVCCGEGGSS